MIEGISTEQLQRYVAMRARFDREARTLSSLTSLLSLLQHCGDDRVEVDPVALGHVHQMMEHCVLNLWEVLDDFIFLSAAQVSLNEHDGD